MDGAGGRTFKRVLVTLPWAVVRFFGRIARRVLATVGVIVALIVLCYVGFESIVETIDSHYAKEIDDYLGIDRSTIARLHDRAYFAQDAPGIFNGSQYRVLIRCPHLCAPYSKRGINEILRTFVPSIASPAPAR